MLSNEDSAFFFLRSEGYIAPCWNCVKIINPNVYVKNVISVKNGNLHVVELKITGKPFVFK